MQNYIIGLLIQSDIIFLCRGNSLCKLMYLDRNCCVACSLCFFTNRLFILPVIIDELLLIVYSFASYILNDHSETYLFGIKKSIFREKMLHGNEAVNHETQEVIAVS